MPSPSLYPIKEHILSSTIFSIVVYTGAISNVALYIIDIHVCKWTGLEKISPIYMHTRNETIWVNAILHVTVLQYTYVIITVYFFSKHCFLVTYKHTTHTLVFVAALTICAIIPLWSKPVYNWLKYLGCPKCTCTCDTFMFVTRTWGICLTNAWHLRKIRQILCLRYIVATIFVPMNKITIYGSKLLVCRFYPYFEN